MKLIKSNKSSQEYWTKTIHSFRSVSLDDMASIIKVLKKSNEMYLIERLTSIQPVILCYVSKIRNQEVKKHGLLEERTALHLRFIRSDNRTQIGSDLYFESVCIEQSSARPIDDNIIRDLLRSYAHLHSIEPMGYPEFLFRQYQNLRFVQ